jgi:methyl halide transferase
MKQRQTDWEQAYRRQQTPWEKGRPHPGLVDFLADGATLHGKVFVPGCGSGHDVRALSTPANHVIGVDIAPSPIAKAKAHPRIASEEYLLSDLFALPATFDGQFDWVFEHTCFCAIDPGQRSEYVATVVRLLRTQGRLFAIFFINPDHDDEGPPFRVSKAELDGLFGEFFSVEREWIPALTYPGREGRELMRVLRVR